MITYRVVKSPNTDQSFKERTGAKIKRPNYQSVLNDGLGMPQYDKENV